MEHTEHQPRIAITLFLTWNLISHHVMSVSVGWCKTVLHHEWFRRSDFLQPQRGSNHKASLPTLLSSLLNLWLIVAYFRPLMSIAHDNIRWVLFQCTSFDITCGHLTLCEATYDNLNTTVAGPFYIPEVAHLAFRERFNVAILFFWANYLDQRTSLNAPLLVIVHQAFTR